MSRTAFSGIRAPLWRWRSLGFGLVLLACALLQGRPTLAEDAPVLRLGLVKFGSGAWLVDEMRQRDLAALSLQTQDLANPAGGEVALQAGAVDAILSDLLWVARQRHAGQKLIFIPRSSALGEVLVPTGSDITSVAQLAGHKIGIAGGPLDKSWLLLRAYGQKVLGYDLADKITPVYGAPPLLSQELAAGRIDAVLTYWPFAARLSVQGAKPLLSVAEMVRGLGLTEAVPVMGFAVRQDWAEAHPAALAAFVAAAQAADHRLLTQDEAWQRLRPLLAAETDAAALALRDRYRGGIMLSERANLDHLHQLYHILAIIGGPTLTGGATDLPDGTVWMTGP